MVETKNQNTVILILLFLLFGFLLGLIGYFLGNVFPLKNINFLKPKEKVSQKIEPSPETAAPSPLASPAPVPEEQSQAEENPIQTKTVNGYHSTFKFDYPSDWQVTVDNTEFSTKVVISKGTFNISIAQGDMGAGRCVFSDEADYNDNIEGPHAKYPDFVQFPGKKETFRRTQYPAQGQFTICSKSPGQTAFVSYSTFGFLRYQTPIFPSEEDLKELDQILGSVTVL